MSATLIAAAGWTAALFAAASLAGVLRNRAQGREAVVRASHELRGAVHAIGLAMGVEAGIACGSGERSRAVTFELERARVALDDLTAGGPCPRRAPQPPTDASAGGRLELLDAPALLMEAAHAARPLARAAGVDVLAEWIGEGATLWGERLRIGQALSNLVRNALEHGAGTVELRGRTVGDTVRFEVRDQGSGLPAPVAELTREARAGRGLRGRGLAIATAIAARHGGRLAAAPTECGAQLVLQLPARRARAASGDGPRTA